MRTVRNATVDVLKRLEENLAFKDIRSMVQGFCSKWYLVGGRAYRTLAEELHSEKCSANDADWDFICFDTTHQLIKFDGLQKTRGPGSTFNPDDQAIKSTYGFTTVRRAINHRRKLGGPKSLPVEERKRSSRFEGGEYGHKVDFIAIEDIKEGGKLEDYFAAVPIDIQAIALDFKQRMFIGDMGIAAVCRKTLRLKNRIALEDAGNDPDTYIEAKKQSLLPMRFLLAQEARHRCFCFPDDIKALFIHGCKCGGI